MKLKIEVESKEYTFEFDRKMIVKAENDGFNLDKVASNPMGMILKLWKWGLMKNHSSMTEHEADRVYEQAINAKYNIPKINEKLFEMYSSFFNPTQPDMTELKEPTIE